MYEVRPQVEASFGKPSDDLPEMQVSLLGQSEGEEGQVVEGRDEMSGMRKFVFVFSGPVVTEKGIGYSSLMKRVESFTQISCNWKVEESHCVPLDTPVRVGDVVLGQSDSEVYERNKTK